jgi:hypothetical protein
MSASLAYELHQAAFELLHCLRIKCTAVFAGKAQGAHLARSHLASDEAWVKASCYSLASHPLPSRHCGCLYHFAAVCA